MSIQWFSPSTNIPIISIASYGITLNIGAVSHLINAKSITTGFDENERKIFIKIHRKEDVGFLFPKVDKNTKSIRIACKDFIQFLQVKSKTDFSKAVKFYATYIPKEDHFVIDLRDSLPEKRKQTKK
ncbi:hypothetical protein U8V72_14425 [Priestia filamentosa]|uniref:hypothetical protein n=1 Tax=Priestia filamentosa TaxID=1402861 RepID=UPI0005894F43